MKNRNLISVLTICAAVIVAAVAAVVVSMNRSAAASARAEAAASEEAAADVRKKAAAAEAAAKADERRAAEANEKAAADKLEAERLANERAKVEERTAIESNLLSSNEISRIRLDNELAKNRLEEARIRESTIRLAQALTNDAARTAQMKAEAARADAEAKRHDAEKASAEAKLRELQKDSLDDYYQRLLELNRDLEERERALTPEKTIADLSWAGGGEDSVIDASGKVVKQVKVAYDPEKDMTISKGSRKLAREQRLVCEASSNAVAAVRAKVVTPLEKLYVDALKENRVIDADFYRKTLKSLYPDWEFKVEK